MYDLKDAFKRAFFYGVGFGLVLGLIVGGCVCSGAEKDAYALTMEKRYDEALTKLNEQEENTPQYYYLKTLCEFALFKKDDGIKSARQLLKFDNLPARYKWVGEHLEYELANMKEDSVDHVAALMKDSERRLSLGQGGHKVQKVQAETIAILDYLIEKMEQQQSGMSASEQAPDYEIPSKSNKSEQAAEKSKVKGTKAPGDVDHKNIAQRGGWGELPPKEQAEAKQYAKEQYPPHYSKIIEQYSKRMAERKRK